MKNFTVIMLCLAGASVSLSGYAQRDNRQEEGIVKVIGNDTIDARRVEKHLKENAPASPKDNGLPRFAIVGKDHQFYVGIGAQFLGEGVFDFGADMPSPVLFTPSAMSKAGAGNGSSVGFGWQSSSVYLNVVALPGTDNQVGLFFKGNFMGNNNSFSCYHFYAKYRGLTAGYTTSSFVDAAAEPMTIDFEGPNGYPYVTLFNASWHQNFTKNFSGSIGIDAPSASVTAGDRSAVVKQRIPSIPVYLQYSWAEGASHVRLSGLVRPIQYRNLVASKNSTLVGLGVQVSGMSKIVGPLSVSYNATYGRGISNYLQDDNGLGVDAVSIGEAGEMGMVKSLGLTAGLNCSFTSKLSGNVVYSHLTNWLPDKANGQSEQYRYGDYVAANLIYAFNRFVSAGVEYDYGHRKDFAGKPLHTNRLQLQLAVTF